MSATRNPTTLMISNEESFDFLFKIVLIGDCGTGKTCIVQRFKSGNFIESHGNTIGVDFSMKAVTVDGKKVKVCTEMSAARFLSLFLVVILAPSNTREKVFSAVALTPFPPISSATSLGRRSAIVN